MKGAGLPVVYGGPDRMRQSQVQRRLGAMLIGDDPKQSGLTRSWGAESVSRIRGVDGLSLKE